MEQSPNRHFGCGRFLNNTDTEKHHQGKFPLRKYQSLVQTSVNPLGMDWWIDLRMSYLLFFIKHVYSRFSVSTKKQGILNLCKIQAKFSCKVCTYIPEFCLMFAVYSCLETDFGRIFQNSQKISCPLTDAIKMKRSTPSLQMVVLGIALVPCCESERSAFLQILEWMIISFYILRAKIPHQQEVTLNGVHTPSSHHPTGAALKNDTCRREHFGTMFSF